MLILSLVAVTSVDAAPSSTAAETWEVPEEGAVAMFRKGDRAFAVGVESGGALAGREVEELRPAPGCSAIQHSKCAQNVETCSGSCTAYLSYWCKPCDCSEFRFCG